MFIWKCSKCGAVIHILPVQFMNGGQGIEDPEEYFYKCAECGSESNDIEKIAIGMEI